MGKQRGGRAPVDPSQFWLIGLIIGGFALLAILWLGGTIGAFFGGAGWNPPAFGFDTFFAVLSGEPVWQGASLTAVVTGMVATVGFVVILAVLVVLLMSGGNDRGGLATAEQTGDLAPKAAAEKARRLRRSLRDRKKIDPADAGLLLGDLHPSGPELRASWEDVAVVFMGPRSGKTSALAVPNILQAPGPCVVTSNKADIYAITSGERARRGRVWLFDPQSIAHADREMWWDMLSMARTIEGADRLAMHLVSATSGAEEGEDFWAKAGRNLLRIVLHAASIDGRNLREVLDWLADPGDQGPLIILRNHGLTALAENLDGTVRGAPETRDGIYEHARQAVACLLDPEVLAWVTPNEDLPKFEPGEFVRSTDALYLLSKDGGGGAAGVIAALTDACLRAAVAVAEASPGGRLDPPMEAILDEACNVCKIQDLPDLYSHLGSRGVLPVTVMQSYEQGVRVWGKSGMDSLWSAATVKLLGSGLDDQAFADRISSLVGETYVDESSASESKDGRSLQRSQRRERILDVSDVREIEKGTALLLATSTRPARLRLRPWFREKSAKTVSADQEAAESAIAGRAAKRLTL
ncbi:type IV secretory system conjugative DNA transfer family protein [Nocardiopsis xinjiangensis]|uniref:type IV secretory system conjugative DNA transfer family protein n=1 Tax=Nocardiopsis xinjiangensis TaxID=124285 RepID=UPI000345CB28|nr:type IV secretory system conjugative DNA transfer family protein [Nocardiopsis xinjiangensis]